MYAKPLRLLPIATARDVIITATQHHNIALFPSKSVLCPIQLDTVAPAHFEHTCHKAQGIRSNMPAPPSPAKRVTRAQSAARLAADDMREKPVLKKKAAKPTKTTTKSGVQPAPLDDGGDDVAPPENSMKRTRRAQVPTLATTARRRIRITPLDAPSTQEEAHVVESSAPKKAKMAAKTRQAATIEDLAREEGNLMESAETVKTRTRGKAKSKESQTSLEPPGPRARGRPKKADVLQLEPQMEEGAHAGRLTRTRAGSGATATGSTAASVARVTVATKKKVGFQDLRENEKENLPVVSKQRVGKARNGTEPTGMRAKPIRKPGPAVARKSGTASSTSKAPSEACLPLSPKKITQIARSPSPAESDEDELNGAKTPVRNLSQSPKRPTQDAGVPSTVKKLDFTAALGTPSRTKSSISTITMSPARRLPQSPFKEALKESPKRGDATPVLPRHVPQPQAASVHPHTASASKAALCQSPKRGAVNRSIFLHSAMKSQKSPLKTSLLQSPAKRATSPIKLQALVATHKAVRPAEPSPKKEKDSTDPTDTMVSCQFRSSGSPERSGRVHKITEEEVAQEARSCVDFDESVLAVPSPIRVSKPTPQSESEEGEASMPVITNDLGASTDHNGSSAEHLEQAATQDLEWSTIDPMEGVLEFNPTIEALSHDETRHRPNDMGAYVFRRSLSHESDDSSEDELQADFMPMRHVNGTPSSRSAFVRPHQSAVSLDTTRDTIGFTPLASQLSGWLASSPLKENKKSNWQRSIFSPAARQHVPGVVQTSRPSTPQRTSNAVRELILPEGAANSPRLSSARASLATSRGGSLGKPTFFDDEMAIKELEEEAEGSQAGASEETIALDESPGDAGEERAEIHDEEEILINHEDQYLQAKLFPEQPKLAGFEQADPAFEEQESILVPAHHGEQSAERSPDVHQNDTPSPPSRHRDDNADPIEISSKEQVDLEELIEPTAPTSTSENEFTPVLQSSMQTKASDFTTPKRMERVGPRFANTVISKVPLRPECYTSPVKLPKKRSRSLSSGPSPARKTVVFARGGMPRSNTVISLSPQTQVPTPQAQTPSLHSFVVDDFGDSTLDEIEVDEENLPPPTPAASIRSTTATPVRNAVTDSGSGVLQGAVVFVDVHTTEGADASGIFVELLAQMGARCVKQWSWNPRASVGVSDEGGAGTLGTINGKIGITHVVYKDGGKRTLEKVRDTGGVVRCVGVGWILE